MPSDNQSQIQFLSTREPIVISTPGTPMSVSMTFIRQPLDGDIPNLYIYAQDPVFIFDDSITSPNFPLYVPIGNTLDETASFFAQWLNYCFANIPTTDPSGAVLSAVASGPTVTVSSNIGTTFFNGYLGQNGFRVYDQRNWFSNNQALIAATNGVAATYEEIESCSNYELEDTSTYGDIEGFTIDDYANGIGAVRISHPTLGNAFILLQPGSVVPADMNINLSTIFNTNEVPDGKVVIDLVKIPALDESVQYKAGDMAYHSATPGFYLFTSDGTWLTAQAIIINVSDSDEEQWKEIINLYFDQIPLSQRWRGGFFYICCTESKINDDINKQVNAILSDINYDILDNSKCKCDYPELLKIANYLNILKAKGFGYTQDNEEELTKIFNRIKIKKCCQCKTCGKKDIKYTPIVPQEEEGTLPGEGLICTIEKRTCTYEIEVPCCTYTIPSIDTGEYGYIEFTVPPALTGGTQLTFLSMSFLFRYIGGSGFSLNFSQLGGSFTRSQILDLIRNNFDDLGGRVALVINDTTGIVRLVPLVPSTQSPSSPSSLSIQTNLTGYTGIDFCANFNANGNISVSVVSSCTTTNSSLSFWFAPQLPNKVQIYKNNDFENIPFEEIANGSWRQESCDEITEWRLLDSENNLIGGGFVEEACPILSVRKQGEEFRNVTSQIVNGVYTWEDSEGGTMFWRKVLPALNDSEFIIINGQTEPDCETETITGSPCVLLQDLQDQISEIEDRVSLLEESESEPPAPSPAPTLQQVTDEGNTTDNNIQFGAGAGVFFDNGSRVTEGTTDAGNGGNGGVALRCSIDYQLKWEAGRLYVMEQNGFTIRESAYNFNITPTVNDDNTKGYVVNSLWKLDNGDTYICTDNTTGAAVWDSVANDTKLRAYVRNVDSVQINKGQPVYIFGATGNRASVKRAFNTSDATSARTLGLAAEDIPAGSSGYVQTHGVLDGLNTGSYLEGDILYLGATAGTLTKVKPYAPNHMVYIGVVERANNGNGQIYIKVQNGYELDEIHDVDLITTPPVNKDVLYYNGTLWKSISVKDLLGGNPVQVVGINSTATALTGSQTNGVLASVLIPANTMTANTIVEFEAFIRKASPSAVANMRVHINTANNMTGAQQLAYLQGASANQMLKMERSFLVTSTGLTIYPVGATANIDDNVANAAPTNVTVDWTINQWIIQTADNAVGETTTNVFLFVKKSIP